MKIVTDYQTYDVTGTYRTSETIEAIGDYQRSIVFHNLAIPTELITEETLVEDGPIVFRVTDAVRTGEDYMVSGSIAYPLLDLIERFSISSGERLSDALRQFGITCNAYGNDVVNVDIQIPHAISLKQVLDDIALFMRWQWVWNKDKVEIIVDEKTDATRIDAIYGIGQTRSEIAEEVHRRDAQRIAVDKVANTTSNISYKLRRARIPVNTGLSLLQKVAGAVEGVLVGIETIQSNHGDSYQTIYVL